MVKCTWRSVDGQDIGDDLQKVTSEGNVRDILGVFKSLIMASYGKRSADGKRFLKTTEIREEFEGSEAYSELLFKLLSDEKEAIAFFQNLLPKNLLEEAVAAKQKEDKVKKEEPAQEPLPLEGITDQKAYEAFNANPHTQRWGQ